MSRPAPPNDPSYRITTYRRSLTVVAAWLALAAAPRQTTAPAVPTLPPAVAVEGADAAAAADMRDYREQIAGTGLEFDMVALPGGSFELGSPPGEADRNDDEGPRVEVEVSPFWIGRHEVTWDEYRQFMLHLDRERERADVPQDALADAVSRPTPPYVPMDFGMGVSGYPAISMTQFAARHYTKWLSMRTGRFYRLPTEAEWEYACRAGDDGPRGGITLERLHEVAWFRDTSERRYHPVGSLEANPWGLHDMLGNVAEWVLDELSPYAAGPDPVRWPQDLYPRVVRGGSWFDRAPRLRCAARRGSSPSWKAKDPQIPQSIWYHTSADFVGLRVVRPLVAPPREEWLRYWEPDDDEVAEILDEQRAMGF